MRYLLLSVVVLIVLKKKLVLLLFLESNIKIFTFVYCSTKMNRQKFKYLLNQNCDYTLCGKKFCL